MKQCDLPWNAMRYTVWWDPEEPDSKQSIAELEWMFFALFWKHDANPFLSV